MRTLAAVLALSLLASPALTRAQTQFEGLDLSDDAKKDEKKEAPVTTEPTPTPAAAPKEEGPPKADEPLVARDTTQDDRVKSVQRKLYQKRMRAEISVMGGTSVNDPFYTKFGETLKVGFHLADTLALAVRGTYMQVQPTDDVRVAKHDFQARIFFSVPIWSAMVDVEWSPIYGKVGFLNSILHFDGYIVGGVGVVNTETSAVAGRGLNAGADLGAGVRFVAKDFLAVNAALINTTYVDQPTGTTKGATQNMLMLYAGLSMFIPFKSTYREAE